jgi:hypothetical protein
VIKRGVMMKLVKFTQIRDEGFFKTKFGEADIWINPENIDYVGDYSANDASNQQTYIVIQSKKIIIKENFRDVMKTLGVSISKGDEK